MKNQFDSNMDKVYNKLTKNIMKEEIIDLDNTLLTFIYPRLLKLYSESIKNEEYKDPVWLDDLQELIYNIHVILDQDYKTEDPSCWQSFYIDNNGKCTFKPLDEEHNKKVFARVEEELAVQGKIKDLLSKLLFTLQLI